MTVNTKKTRSGKGLFRATGKTAKPVAVLCDGVIIKQECLIRETDDFYPTPPEPTRAIIAAEYQRFWPPTEYIGGSRTVEKLNGAILPTHRGMDMSIPARIRAWELGEPIAPKLIINLTKLDRALEKEVIR